MNERSQRKVTIFSFIFVNCLLIMSSKIKKLGAISRNPDHYLRDTKHDLYKGIFSFII